MNCAERQKLEDAAKNLTLLGLNKLIEHNAKGVDLIKKGIDQALEIKEELEAHYEELKTIIKFLKPVFEVAREWLVECYYHLVMLFDWAKEKCNEIFG